MAEKFKEVRPVDVFSYICFDANNPKPYMLVNAEKPRAKVVMGKMLDAFNIEAFDGTTMEDQFILDTIKFQCGYSIDVNELQRVSLLAAIFVDDNIDKFCHLCLINVTDLIQNESILVNNNIETHWVTRKETFILNTWKPMSILNKVEIISELNKVNTKK
jgi:hypothetical protein